MDAFDKWLNDCPLQEARMAYANGHGITWYDLARRAGLSQLILIKWSEGAILNPRPENVAAVGAVLNDPTFSERFYDWIAARPTIKIAAYV